MKRIIAASATVLVTAAVTLLPVAAPAEAAAAKCHSKVAKNLGPQYAANAKGTFRVKWCVDKKKRVHNVRPSLDVDITTLGNAQGYDVVWTRVTNTKGGAFKKNPRKKSYTLHASYKIKACVPIVERPCVDSTYKWSFKITNKGKIVQKYIG